MGGLLSPDVEEKVIGSAEILEIFKVSKVGKVAGSKVVEGEITQDSSARVIRDGAIIFNGKIGTIFREKNQTKQVSAGLECGITLKDFADFQKKDIIEVYNATITEEQFKMKNLGKPITQRQLRVGEMIKQALGTLFYKRQRSQNSKFINKK